MLRLTPHLHPALLHPNQVPVYSHESDVKAYTPSTPHLYYTLIRYPYIHMNQMLRLTPHLHPALLHPNQVPAYSLESDVKTYTPSTPRSTTP